MEPTADTCPACKSPKLWHMSTEMHGKECHIQFQCLDCNKIFKEIYYLSYQRTEQQT